MSKRIICGYCGQLAKEQNTTWSPALQTNVHKSCLQYSDKYSRIRFRYR